MILRLFRGGVRFEDEEALLTYVRERAVPGALATPGLLSLQPAVRPSPEGLEVVLVSTWTQFDAILSQGRDLDTVISVPETADLVEGGWADHYELVVGNARRLPLTRATLQVTRVPLERGLESAYFERFRADAEDLLDREGLVAFLLGRRTVGQTTEALSITVEVETDATATPRPGSGGPVGSAREPFYAAPPMVERFEALSMAPARPDAPAILLADDARHYLHATRAAAELTGHSVARLMTMRIDDLTTPELRPEVPAMWQRFLASGSMESDFALRRRDGSMVPVRFSARARAPWPGAHASMLVPLGALDPPDIQLGLVEAGFVSRFVPADERTIAPTP